MKKYIKFIPHVIIAALFLMGAYGKLTGSAEAVGMFTTLDIFGQPEQYARIFVGLAELYVGIGIFCKKTQKHAAFVGFIIMIVALYYHATLFGFGTSAMAWVGLLATGYILWKNKCCGVCTKTCDEKMSCGVPAEGREGKCLNCEAGTCTEANCKKSCEKCESGVCTPETHEK